MKLGILVNTDRHAEQLAGITRAALSQGHEVIVFFMDDGVRLLENRATSRLCEHPRVSMSYCDYSTQKIGISKDCISSRMVCGSQYDNARMNHAADRVMVL